MCANLKGRKCNIYLSVFITHSSLLPHIFVLVQNYFLIISTFQLSELNKK